MKPTVKFSFQPELKWLLPAFLIFASAGCEKPEGPSGRGSISGQVMVTSYDHRFRVVQSEYPAADEDVYIYYGSSATVSDDRKTSDKGRFEFSYLSKGDYRILVYSEDSTGNSLPGLFPVEKSVSLGSNNEARDLGQIRILQTLDFDDGQATLSGKVSQVNYTNDFVFIVDTIPGQDIEVYLVYEDDPQYCERIRTMPDGSFSFDGLIKGRWTVYVFSKDTGGGTALVPVISEVDINAIQGDFDAGTLFTAKD